MQDISLVFIKKEKGRRSYRLRVIELRVIELRVIELQVMGLHFAKLRSTHIVQDKFPNI